jgi:hypothetical protein
MTANEAGAVVGEHRVSISKIRTVAIPQAHGYPVYQSSHLIPEKYSKAATSGLTANVVDDDNYFEFKLSP